MSPFRLPLSIKMPLVVTVFMAAVAIFVTERVLSRPSPPFDPTGNTALVGATMMFEILCILSEAQRARRQG